MTAHEFEAYANTGDVYRVTAADKDEAIKEVWRLAPMIVASFRLYSLTLLGTCQRTEEHNGGGVAA